MFIQKHNQKWQTNCLPQQHESSITKLVKNCKSVFNEKKKSWFLRTIKKIINCVVGKN